MLVFGLTPRRPVPRTERSHQRTELVKFRMSDLRALITACEARTRRNTSSTLLVSRILICLGMMFVSISERETALYW